MSLLRKAEKCLASQKTHARLNALVTPLQPSGPWLERVKDAEARREKGIPASKLDGKLLAIKDNICTRELTTTCASGILNEYTSPYNATVIDTLERAGAIVAGKTNLDEFGMGSHSTHSYFGTVKNPVGDSSEAISVGGSSGGSAVAVATGQCHAALGTDTGGSVRLPAAYTGTVGFKPSYGLISRWGVVAYANSLDTVGVMGQTTPIVKDVFNILNHHDRRDPTNISENSRSRIMDAVKKAHRRREHLRIGVPSEYNIRELTPSVRQTWRNTLQHLQNQGHSIHSVSLPATKQALSAYYVLAPAEASSNLAKYDGIRYGTRPDEPDNAGGYLYANTRGKGFGAEVKRRILLGAFSLSADAIENYFIQAQKVRRLVQQDFDRVFSLSNPLAAVTRSAESTVEEVDVLVCPTAPSPAPTLKSLESASPVDAYMNDVFTVPASLAGLPALSVPVSIGADNGSGKRANSVSIQVIGQYGDDDLVLDVGGIIEGMK